MRYVELFAGAGGLSRGLDAAGMTCDAHAEIEPHARAVLRRHWPDTPLYGDVTAVDWTVHRGVDLVAGGSPCQDLSVAGKRAGLEGARSGLFFELVRAWNETGAPYCLWENVDGARSSNKGADFAAVLSAFVGAAVAVPADGWRSSGVAAGSTGVAAWRVLDLQHFGPPQRRRRVFVLAARAGGCDPAEVLALSEGLCGHPAPRERQSQDAAGGAASGVGGGIALNISDGQPRLSDTMATLDKRSGGSGVGAQTSGAVLAAIPLQEIGKRTGVSTTDVRAGIGIGEAGDAMYTLQATAQHGVMTFAERGSVAFTPGNLVRGAGDAPSDVMQTLKADFGRGSGDQSPHVLAFEPRYYTRDNKTGGAPSDLVKVDASIGKNGDAVPHVLAFHPTQDPISGSVSSALGRTTEGMGVVCTTGPVTHALPHEGADASEDGTGSGTPIVVTRDQEDAQILPCLPASLGGSPTGHNRDELIIATITSKWAKGSGGYAGTTETNNIVVAPTLNMGAHTAAPGSNGQDAAEWAAITVPMYGRPRRLTPLECERLMSWPDNWTAEGVREDGTRYALSDTARYRLCGNGVGSVVAQWIGQRLLWAETFTPSPEASHA